MSEDPLKRDTSEDDTKPEAIALRSGEPREGHPCEHEPAPGAIKDNGQHSDYWVLSQVERDKGFIRPVRLSYVHRGARPTHPTCPLTEEQLERYPNLGYVSYEKYPEEDGRGRFWTQKKLDSGCGGLTTMQRPIAETYARQPSFYGSTMCVHCREHFSVEEFVWDGTEELLGS